MSALCGKGCAPSIFNQGLQPLQPEVILVYNLARLSELPAK